MITKSGIIPYRSARDICPGFNQIVRLNLLILFIILLQSPSSFVRCFILTCSDRAIYKDRSEFAKYWMTSRRTHSDIVEKSCIKMNWNIPRKPPRIICLQLHRSEGRNCSPLLELLLFTHTYMHPYSFTPIPLGCRDGALILRCICTRTWTSRSHSILSLNHPLRPRYKRVFPCVFVQLLFLLPS